MLLTETVDFSFPVSPQKINARLWEDAVLIIYSVLQTKREHLDAVKQAVNCFARVDVRTDREAGPLRMVKTRAKVFEIPKQAEGGGALGTSLMRELRSCVGAIAFIDDLRPNIAYEIGIFHGMNAPVLLLTSNAPGEGWSRLSDLAGAPLPRFSDENVTQLVHDYLDELFSTLEMDVERSPTFAVPVRNDNLLSRKDVTPSGSSFESDARGPYGRLYRISGWDNSLDFMLNRSVTPDARFKVTLRTPNNAHYAIYFEVSFVDHRRKERQLWLGLSSWLKSADYCSDERNLPADSVGKHWQYVTGTFAGLLRRAHVAGASKLTLKRVRFRAGEPHTENTGTLEIGFLDVTGIL
jgi:hypothetical protein